MNNWMKKIILPAVLILAAGCASFEESLDNIRGNDESTKESREAREDQALKDKMDSLLGKSRKEVILEMGAPFETKSIGGLEILVYVKKHIMHEEKLNCYFDGDKLVKWDYSKK